VKLERITIGPLTFIPVFHHAMFIAVDVKSTNGFDVGVLRLTLKEWRELEEARRE
jgi:hypothetical protein